jgi:predicted kinase
MSPALITVGGFAGTGKTAISKRLSAELGIPRLGSDTLGRTIKKCIGTNSSQVHAYWIAYEVLFHLCEEFIQTGISTILDLTMGWEFQWQQVDSIMRQYPRALFLPIILRCPYEKCIERVRQRYEATPEYYDPPEVYMTEPKNIGIWEYLAKLDRPAVHFVDASEPHDKVYEQVKVYVSTQLDRDAA